MDILDIKKFGRVGVLRGGPSPEHEISLESGKAVLETLKGVMPEVIDLKIPKQEYNNEKDIENYAYTLLKKTELDVVFIALHGYFGEDGKIQKILEDLSIPYTGSGQRASRLAMDKIASREIFSKNNIPVPDYKILDKKSNNNVSNIHSIKQQYYHLSNRIKFPVVVKPHNLGSSIGLNIASTYRELKSAIKEAFNLSEKIILEEYIDGREITVGILGEKLLPPIEIIPKLDKFYNYNAKYTCGATEYIVPAELSDEILNEINKFALGAYNSLGCKGCARIDMILSRKNNPFILEVNTIPGLTKNSLIPKAAKQIGIDFRKLILTMLSHAIMAFKKESWYVKIT